MLHAKESPGEGRNTNASGGTADELRLRVRRESELSPALALRDPRQRKASWLNSPGVVYTEIPSRKFLAQHVRVLPTGTQV